MSTSRARGIGLLGAHVLGCAEQLAVHGEGDARCVVVGERLRDAEVDHLHLWRTVGGGADEDLRRLQVAVDDRLGLRMLDGVGGIGEQRHALADRRRARGAPLGDRRAVDELHDKAGAPARREPAVEHARDARVLHPRERLPLCVEAPQHGGGVHARLHDLDRDALLVRRAAQRLPDRAVAALADRRDEFIRTDPVARLLEGGGETRLQAAVFARCHGGEDSTR